MFEVNYKKILNWFASLSTTKVVFASALVFIGLAGFSIFDAMRSLPTEAPKTSRPRGNDDQLEVEKQPLSAEGQKAILDRNLFNSEGKLGDYTEDEGPARVISGTLVKSDLPLDLKGVIFAGDPQHGLAMIENTQNKRMKSYIVGDIVTENAKVLGIYETRVIFDREGNREYIELKPFELTRSRRRTQGRPSPSGSSRIATRPPPDSYREVGFERQGAEIRLSEEFKRSLLAPDSMAQVLQDAKAEPNMVNGELRGFRLTRIRENSIYEKAGFQNDDVVEEINGIPLRDAAGAIRLLQQLKDAKDIEVRVNRGGVSQDMMISIQ
ncbi:MAG: type II secretion system protein N [Oligoflexus sp.]